MGNKIEKGKGSEACVGILKDGHGEVFVHPKITQVDQLSSIRKALHTSYPNLVNSLTNITMLTDMRHKRQKIILASRGFTELTGYHPSFFMGKNCRFLQGPGTSPDAVEALRVAIRTASPIQVAILNYKRDGTPFLNGLTMMPLRCSKSKPFRLTHYLAIQTDCTPSNSISRGLPFPKEASAATPLSLSLASSSSSSSSFTTPTAAGASSSTSSLTSSNPPASSAKAATSAKSLLSPSFLALSSSSSLVYETSAAEVPGSAKRRPSQSQDESTRGGSESDSFSSMTSADYSSIGSRSVTSQPHSSSNFGSQQSVSSTGLLSDMPRHDITVTADQRALASRLMAVQKILGTSPEPVTLPPNEVPPTVGPEEVLLSSDITSQTWDENLFPKIDTPFWSLFVCCQQRDAFSAVADQLATLNNVRLIRQDLTQVIRRIVAPQTRATSSSEAVSSDFSAEIPNLGSVDLDGQNIQLPAALVVPCTSYPTDLEHQPQIFTELLSILSSEQRKSVLSLLSSIVSHRYQGEMPVGGVALLRLSSQCALIFVSLGPWRLVAHDSPYHIFKSVLRAFCRAQTAPHMFQQVLGCHPSTATSPPLVNSLFCLPFHNSCVYPTLVPSHEPSFISTAGQMQLAYLEVASHFYPHPSSCSPVAPAQRARAIAQAIVALDQYSPSPSVRILSLLRKGELWSRGLFDTAEVQIFISIVGGKEPSQTKADQGEAAKVALQFLSSPNTLGSPELRDEIREGVLSHISEVLPIIGSEVRFYTEIAHADLQFSKSVVGRGGTSTVLRAQWDGKEVAVKRFVDASPSLVVRELNVMALLKHPHVVTFYGACTLPMPHEEDRTYAVMELAGNQTIFHLLHPRNSPRKSPRSSSSSSSSSSSPRMDTNEILSRYALAWLYQISLAIEYLHSHSLIHRDIKSCNVLLFEDYAVAKLTDYGLTRFQFNPDVAMTASIGTPNWMAPEILLDAKYSFPADIWSLGMIIYEVITRAIPFEACKTSAAISKEISSGHVPTLSGPFFDTLSPTNKRVLTTIYRGCTHTRPAKRLSAHETSFMLSKLVVK